jgi:hypothetical protein
VAGNWRRDSSSVDCATTSTGSRRCIFRMQPSFCSKNWPRWISPLACLPTVLACPCGKEDKDTSRVDRDKRVLYNLRSFLSYDMTKTIFAFVPVALLIIYVFSYSTPLPFFCYLDGERTDWFSIFPLAFLWRTKDARWTVTYLDLILLWFTCDCSENGPEGEVSALVLFLFMYSAKTRITWTMLNCFYHLSSSLVVIHGCY